MATRRSRSWFPTTATGRATETRAVTGSSGCVSASPSTAASSTRDLARRAASRCGLGCRWRTAMSEPPSGTVTLLFTDIEGSTVLLRQLRERYGEILAQQYDILRTAIEDVGGRQIGTQGDAVFALCQKPKDAILAAVAAQR